MSTTIKYEFETIAYSTTGWNGILTADIEKMEEYLHTFLLVTLGEDAEAYQAVYLDRTGKAYKARFDHIHQPAIGLLIEDGSADDTNIRVQRVGPITNSEWSWWPGRPVFLSDSIYGGLTQDWVLPRKQALGIAITSTTIILFGTIDQEALATDGNVLRPASAMSGQRIYPAQYISE